MAAACVGALVTPEHHRGLAGMTLVREEHGTVAPACPALDFTDKGKLHLALPEEIAKAVCAAFCGACKEHLRRVFAVLPEAVAVRLARRRLPLRPTRHSTTRCSR